MPPDTIVSTVTGFRGVFVGLFTDILDVGAAAVTRMLLWLPDCTAVELDPRPQFDGPRPPSTAGGMVNLVCTPNATRVVVSVLVDTSLLPPPADPGQSTNDVAVAAVTRVFTNTTRYAVSVGTVYTSWEAAVNVSSGPAARTVDLMYAGVSSAPPPPSRRNLFGAALAVALVAAAFILLLFVLRNRKCRCRSAPAPVAAVYRYDGGDKAAGPAASAVVASAPPTAPDAADAAAQDPV